MGKDFTEYEKLRAESVQAILDSSARKKAIIAGPGTGKTFTFRRVLEAVGGEGLVLSFINNLVNDLKVTLGSLATVSTFHSYCRRLLHTTTTQGIDNDFFYYASLLEILADDLNVVFGMECVEDDVQEAFQKLETGSGIIRAALICGNYYNAVSPDDSVYRVLRHFTENAEDIPSYPLVIVDEYQDFCTLEVRLLELLSSKSPVLLAGDDDQALYGFKNASAEYLRALVQRSDFAKFQLPFCSRCTEIMVQAANHFVRKAQENGLLLDRIPKPFQCYLPDKYGDSQTYPRIVHGDCSVQNVTTSPYISKYIAWKILNISPEEIEESAEQGYPTVLIAGPRYITRHISDYLKQHFGNVTFVKRSDDSVQLSDAYLRLMAIEESRIAWRIVIFCDPIDNISEVLRKAIIGGEELCELLTEDYREKHLSNVGILKRMKAEEAISGQEKSQVSQALGLSFAKIEELLDIEHDDETLFDEPEVELAEDSGPRIVITTHLGAKGLDAGHVFLIGINEGDLPKSNRSPTDDEASKFLVSMTRARKCCYIVTCRVRGGTRQTGSIFLDWIRPFIESEWIDKNNIAQFDSRLNS